jgi:hypothetical protein
MKMTGHETESVYRQRAIVEEGMLRESGEKLAALYSGEKIPLTRSCRGIPPREQA